MGYLTAVPSDISIMQAFNGSADTKSTLHGQFQEKEKPSHFWIEHFPFTIKDASELKHNFFQSICNCP